jgi:copper homeostasis protein CutC
MPFVRFLQDLVALCGSRMTILAGGGLTAENLPSFVSVTGVREVHASLRGEWVSGGMGYRREGVYMGGEKRNDGLHIEYATKSADETKIRVVTGHASDAGK